jgi:hypothetical protein
LKWIFPKHWITPFVMQSTSDDDGNNGGDINVLPIIKSVGTDVCHVTQGGPRLCEMRNHLTKLEDAVREAPSVATTRHVLPHPINIISCIDLSYQAIIRKLMRPTHGSQ